MRRKAICYTFSIKINEKERKLTICPAAVLLPAIPPVLPQGARQAVRRVLRVGPRAVRQALPVVLPVFPLAVPADLRGLHPDPLPVGILQAAIPPAIPALQEDPEWPEAAEPVSMREPTARGAISREAIRDRI